MTRDIALICLIPQISCTLVWVGDLGVRGISVMGFEHTSRNARAMSLERFDQLNIALAGLRSSDMRRMSRLRDPVEYMRNVEYR
ncbi:unnamed protein product [Haemonchus placei]|uniref:DUF1127 domain-containing protein n=1 Tax=Haemonchus placei TaxID=6290 RepID=A0A3P7UHN3_HAEPC|nr:unnamed protein product [Haemonchus placei]